MNIARAAQLQAEVQALKQQLHRDLKVEKAGPGQPFPLSLTLQLALPDSAAAFDLSHLQIRVTIAEDALSGGGQHTGVTRDTVAPACKCCL